jgi:hypothetical protein
MIFRQGVKKILFSNRLSVVAITKSVKRLSDDPKGYREAIKADLN